MKTSKSPQLNPLSLLFIFAVSLLCNIAFAAAATDGAKALSINSSPSSKRELFGGVWRVDHTFQSTLRIRNILATSPITVTPVLYMADGTEYVLPPTQLANSGMQSVNINDALRSAPATIAAHLSNFGSVALRFEHEWNAVSALIDNTDAPRSLVFAYHLQEFLPTDPASQVIEGLWWKHDPGVVGFVTFTNSTAKPVTAQYQITGSIGTRAHLDTLTVAPHSTEWVNLGTLVKKLSQAEQQAGGITIRYTADVGALTVSGGWRMRQPAILPQCASLLTSHRLLKCGASQDTARTGNSKCLPV